METNQEEEIQLLLDDVARSLEGSGYVARASLIWLKKLGVANALVVATSEDSFMSVFGMFQMVHEAFRMGYMMFKGSPLPEVAFFEGQEHGELNLKISRVLAMLGENVKVVEVQTPENQPVLILVASYSSEILEGAMAKIAMMLDTAKKNPHIFNNHRQVICGNLEFRASTVGLPLNSEQRIALQKKQATANEVKRKSVSFNRYLRLLSLKSKVEGCWQKIRKTICS